MRKYPIQVTLPSGYTFTMMPAEFDALARANGYVPALTLGAPPLTPEQLRAAAIYGAAYDAEPSTDHSVKRMSGLLAVLRAEAEPSPELMQPAGEEKP